MALGVPTSQNVQGVCQFPLISPEIVSDSYNSVQAVGSGRLVNFSMATSAGLPLVSQQKPHGRRKHNPLCFGGGLDLWLGQLATTRSHPAACKEWINSVSLGNTERRGFCLCLPLSKRTITHVDISVLVRSAWLNIHSFRWFQFVNKKHTFQWNPSFFALGFTNGWPLNKIRICLPRTT